jgi:orotidine-5'-phosphate decarboxylase
MNETKHSAPRVLVALDFPETSAVMSFVDRVTPDLCRLKVGKELFTAAGPQLVETLANRGFDVFLDLKFHDIPNTVAGAVRSAANLGVWMVNVHALGGRTMMEAARAALAELPRPPLLIAVTVLTSMDRQQLHEIGLDLEPAVLVERLALLAKKSGMDGVVCSAQEATALKALCGQSFQLVTPGIRPADAAADDQSRVMTPTAAFAAGSDYLVIGRPITRSSDPVATLLAINEQLAAVVR